MVVVVIGKTGTGKSSLCNALLLGDTLNKEELFNTSSSVNACTYLTNAKQGTLMDQGGQPLMVIDTPGLSENMKADSDHIINMIKFLKEDIQFVKLFIFTVNGQEPRFDNATRLLLKTFEASLGELFWKHCAVAYTRWGHTAEQERNRKRSNLSEEGRRNEVIAMLNKECPASKGKTISVYFTDTFEMEAPGYGDPTSAALQELYTHARTLNDFACSDTVAVHCTNWQDQYQILKNNYNSAMERISGYGPDYKDRFREKFSFLLDMELETKKGLTQDEFDQYGKDIQKASEELRDEFDVKEKERLAAQKAKDDEERAKEKARTDE